LLKAGDIAGARAALSQCRPEEVIKQYAGFSSLGGMTRGEQGMVVALNVHWLVHYVQQRQALGVDPVRCKFGPTSHEPLAQTPGLFTYHFDAGHNLWQTLGTKETGAHTFVLPPTTKVTLSKGQPEVYAEVCRAGIETAQPIRLTLRPLMSKGALAQGRYRLRLFMLDPTSTAAGQRVFTVSTDTEASTPTATSSPPSTTDRVDIFQATGRANQVLERSYRLGLASPGVVNVRLTPQKGAALVCAAILEPID
jgi:hypothetical protein